MISTDFGYVSAAICENWKSGLIDRISVLMEKAILLDQRVDLMTFTPVPGAKMAHLKFLVSDSEYGQQTYNFTVADCENGDDYHLFTPEHFVCRHDRESDISTGYSLSDIKGQELDAFLYDLGSNCQVDGEIDRDNFTVKPHIPLWVQ